MTDFALKTMLVRIQWSNISEELKTNKRISKTINLGFYI